MQTKEERQEGAFALIAAVSEEPMFWDKQAKDFKNIEVKQQKWAEIAFNLGYQDGQTAASKWRNIRDYYAAIKRKCARGRKVTEWPPYFDQLRFLDENDQSMEPNLIKENGSRSFDALTNYRQGHDSGEGRRYVGSASAKATTSSRQLRPILKASPTSNRLVITAATPNKRRRTFADEVRRVDAVTGQIRRIDEQIGVDQILTLLKERESQHSEEDYYGKSVAAILKRLPPYKRALARCRIDQLLFDIEYGEDNGKEQRRQLGLPKRKENQNGKQDIKQRQHQQFALQQLEFDYEDEEQLEEEEEELAELDEVKVDVDDNNEEELVEEDDAEAGNAVGWEEEGESSNKAVESTKPGRKPRRYWVRPLFQERTTFGAFYQLLPQLRADEQKFIEFAGMSPPLFDRLVEIVGPRLEKTSVRTPIGPQQRLLLTLNFLATGNTFRGLSFLFRISHAAICHIVRETCHAIWEALWAECLPHPSEADWRQAAMGYWDRWQSPNTIGSIDARQLSIKKPAAFSIVLLAVSDHRYRFIYLDVGSYGTDSDGRIFERSAFKEALDTNALNLPPAAALPGADDVVVPHFFVGDAGFPHLPNLQTPIPAIANQQQQMSWEQQIFNYRINRARIPVENAFGLLCARWRILLRQLETTVDNSIRIVKAACVLHNFLCVHETGNNIPATLADVGDQPNGAWRQQISQHLPQAPLRTSCDQLQTTSRLRVEEEAEAMEVRHKLMHFCATVGAVEWQG